MGTLRRGTPDFTLHVRFIYGMKNDSDTFVGGYSPETTQQAPPLLLAFEDRGPHAPAECVPPLLGLWRTYELRARRRVITQTQTLQTTTRTFRARPQWA